MILCRNPVLPSVLIISTLVSFVRSRGTCGWKPSHHIPVFALYNLEPFSRSHSFSFGKASSNLFHSSFSKACPSNTAHLDQRSSSPCWGLRDPVQEARTAFRTLYHLTGPLLVQCFLLPLVFLYLLQPIISCFAWCLPSCMAPSFLAICRQQLSHPPSVSPSFCLNTLRHNLHSLLPLHLFSLRRTLMHAYIGILYFLLWAHASITAKSLCFCKLLSCFRTPNICPEPLP